MKTVYIPNPDKKGQIPRKKPRLQKTKLLQVKVV